MKLAKIRKAILKFILGTALGVSVAVLISFNILLAWVATGPRSLNVLSPYIERAFEPPDHKYSMSIGETWLIWDGWKHPIDINLRNVKVVTNERHTYSKFPEISLGLDIIGLFEGHILPTSLTITHPVIGLFQNEDRSVSFGLESEEATPDEEGVPFAVILAPFLTPDEHSSLRALHLISIINADLTMSNKSKGIFFKTSGADFTIKRNREGLRAFMNARIAYDKYQSSLSAEFSKKRNSPLISGEVTVNQLMPGTLADLFAGNTFVSAMKFPISGKASMLADMDGGLQKISFAVDGGEGTFDTDKMEHALPIKKLHAEGQIDHNTTTNDNTLDLAKFDADLDGTLLSAHGTVALRGKDPEVHAVASIQNVAAQDVHLFWPPGLAPISRDWVTTNITDGKITDIQAKINIAPGDIAKPILPQQDVDAMVVIEGAKIRYLPEHPEVTAVNGKIHIDGMSLEATLDSAHYMKDTKLSAGRVYIADLNPDNPYLKVNLTAESTAKDVIHLLELPPLKHAQRLNLLADQAEGKVKGTAELGFRFFASHDSNGDPDVDFNIKAELSGISQAGFMKKFDGKNVSGTMAIDNQSLEFTGGGDINGASVTDANIKYLFKPEGGFDTFIKATAIAPVEVLPRFGYPAFEFLKGAIGVKANVKEGKNIEANEATIDLTNATVTLPLFKLQKPNKNPATLTITAQRKDDLSTIPSFNFKGKDLEAKGSAELSKDMSGLRRVRMDRLVAGNTNLDQLFYEHTDTNYSVEMHGSAVDLTPWFAGKDSKEESDFSFENFPALQVKTDVARLIFGPDRTLLSVKGGFNCAMKRCESANIAGATSDGKPFNFRILRNPKGKRQLSLHAQSAGIFLRDLNIFDGMEGGDLTITGNYSESASANSILRGRVDINEHTVKNASVLAKILSLASLTGFFDTLQGKGIRFVHLTAPFTLTKDVITLEKAKTHGPALGMTADGTLTFPKGTLDIQGTIVPSYTLNNVLGNVPLIGGLLTGGEGQGIFAARYTIKGNQNDPKISVNPLSILTPGFLRGVFDIMDSPKKDEDDSE